MPESRVTAIYSVEKRLFLFPCVDLGMSQGYIFCDSKKWISLRITTASGAIIEIV